jgi:hypothetical protein
MKTSAFKLVLLIVAVMLPLLGATQKLEAEKTHNLSKDAQKGYLGSFNYDEGSKTYTMVFVREKNKKTIYVTYKFDYDFNQLSEEEEELSLVQASKKYKWVDYEEGSSGWNNPTVVRVDASAWGLGQIVLRKGDITRKWATDYYTTSGVNYTTHNWVGYWKYEFVEKEKVKPQIEVPVEIDPRAPKFVRTMAENAAKKIFLVAYQTDEPDFEVTTGARSFHPKFNKTIWERKRDYISATGNISFVGRQYYAVDKTYFNRFIAQVYSASDLKLKNQSLIEIDYGADVIYSKVLPDKSIAFVVAPLPAVYVKPAKPNPNSRAFIFFRVDKNANLLNRIEFESPSSKWDINSIDLKDNGDIYIFGEAIKKDNDKYHIQQQTNNKFDNFQLMKISNGKMDYITSTPLEEFSSKLQVPSSMKKFESYDGKKFDVGDLSLTSSGDIIISGQKNEGGKFGDISLFHFGNDGKLKAQYGYKLAETGKEATSQGTLHVEFENVNGKLTWIIYEMRGVEKSRLLMYPNVATIDLTNAKISDVTTYGVSKQAEYFIDNSNPVLLIDGDKKLVFFGTDKKDKTLWFSRSEL